MTKRQTTHCGMTKKLAVGCQFVFEGGGEFCEALALAFFFVDVLDGDDAAGDLAVRGR